MRTLYREHDQRRALELIRDPESAPAGVWLHLSIGGRDYSDLNESGSVSSAMSTPTIGLKAKLAGRMNRTWRNAPVRLEADFDGVRILLLDGTIGLPIPSPDSYYTDLIGFSPGWLLDKVRLKPTNTATNRTEYSGWPPHAVIRDALHRVTGVGGYDPGRIRIAPINSPELYFVSASGGDTGTQGSAFEDNVMAGEVLNRVGQIVPFLARDTAERGIEVIEPPGTGSGLDPAWHYDVVGGREVHSWTQPTPVSPEEQYTEVLVRDKKDDGSYRVAWEEFVYYWDQVWPLHAGRTLVVDFPDVGAGHAERGRQLAVDQARSIGTGGMPHQNQPTVSFNPFLQLGDPLTFSSEHEDDLGRWHYDWRSVVHGWDHQWGPMAGGQGIQTVLDMRHYMIREVRLPDPPIRLLGVSAGVKRLRKPFGTSLGEGFWFDRTAMAPHAYVGTDEVNGFWIDEAASSGMVQNTLAGGLSFEI